MRTLASAALARLFPRPLRIIWHLLRRKLASKLCGLESVPAVRVKERKSYFLSLFCFVLFCFVFVLFLFFFFFGFLL